MSRPEERNAATPFAPGFCAQTPDAQTPCVRTLWSETAAAGLAADRVIADEHGHLALADLRRGRTLRADSALLDDAVVVLRTGSQRATAAALLELDGRARRVVLCTPDLSAGHLDCAVAVTDATAIVTDAATEPASLAGLDMTRLQLVSAGAPSADLAPLVSDAPPATARATEWVLFTSGTTGAPKMVPHSLRTLAGAIPRPPTPVPTAGTPAAWSTFYDIRRYGGLQILLRALLGGGSMILSGASEAPTEYLARVAAAGVSFISGTPTHWRRALLSPAAGAIRPANVRLSGEVADQAILDKLRAAYPEARVCHAFASTEAGVAFEVCDGLAGFPAEWVGTSRGGVALRVADGTLRIRSARTAACYLGPDMPALRDAEDFVDTQDVVTLRDGRYHFSGRRDGVINVGGLKVHPEEVEAVVNRHPRVEMSLARPKRSPIIGAVVVVDVVLRDGATAQGLEAEILETCRQDMPWYKVPAMVRVVPSLQIGAGGKLIRPAG